MVNKLNLVVRCWASSTCHGGGLGKSRVDGGLDKSPNVRGVDAAESLSLRS